MTSRVRVRMNIAGKLPPEARIRHRGDFTRIQKRGLRAHAQGITIVAHQTEAGPGARLGCAISRRVGNAVVRNRLRRLFREVFRRSREHLPPVDFVVIARDDAQEIFQGRFDLVEAQLLAGIERACAALEHRARRRAQAARTPSGGSTP